MAEEIQENEITLEIASRIFADIQENERALALFRHKELKAQISLKIQENRENPEKAL